MKKRESNVIFAHDHYFLPLGEQVYSESQFDTSLWSRYTENFDKVLVVARQRTPSNDVLSTDLVLSSAPSVSFEYFENLSSFKSLTVSRPRLYRAMEQLVHDCDAVIVRLPSEIGLLAAAVCISAGKPFAVEVVGCAFDAIWNYGGLKGRLYAPLNYLRMRSVVKKAPFVLYVTNYFLQTRYPNLTGSTCSVSNVVIPQPSPLALDERITKISCKRSESIRLGIIATLNGRYKGIQTVLLAMKKLGNEFTNLTFHVLGAGDQTAWKYEVEELNLGESVVFEGTLNESQEVYQWLDNLDVYIQPSLTEGLPRALIEAMSRGCPAIASRVAGIPELLSDTDLFPPGDVDELASMLRQRLRDSDWMKSAAIRNWNKSTKYSKQKLEPRRREFYSSFARFAHTQ